MSTCSEGPLQSLAGSPTAQQQAVAGSHQLTTSACTVMVPEKYANLHAQPSSSLG